MFYRDVFLIKREVSLWKQKSEKQLSCQRFYSQVSFYWVVVRRLAKRWKKTIDRQKEKVDKTVDKQKHKNENSMESYDEKVDRSLDSQEDKIDTTE